MAGRWRWAVPSPISKAGPTDLQGHPGGHQEGRRRATSTCALGYGPFIPTAPDTARAQASRKDPLADRCRRSHVEADDMTLSHLPRRRACAHAPRVAARRTAACCPDHAPQHRSTPGQHSHEIQQIKSPGGIEAWLVEEHSVPLMAMRFSFEGGNAQDPVGKEGLANFLTAMIDEGAGDLDAAAFQERMEDFAMRMGFDDGRVMPSTAASRRLPAIATRRCRLLKLAMTKPRFDTDAVDRIRRQLIAISSMRTTTPTRPRSSNGLLRAFAGHPYGRPANGTEASISSITGRISKTTAGACSPGTPEGRRRRRHQRQRASARCSTTFSARFRPRASSLPLPM